ncbi:MAG: non-canonical purine NTP pyrophosphatase [Candidatus Babeliales bacterium]
MNTIVIGTNNPSKYAAIKEIVSVLPYTFISLAEAGITHDVAETGTTYAQNAILKAETYARMSGLPTIADDSGIEIAALNGAPGVYSSRFAGEHKTDQEKIDFMLYKLRDVPDGSRQAQFISVVAFAQPEGTTQLFQGISRGTIALHAQGTVKKGFPYYSIYIPEGFNQTVNEILASGKTYNSHRAQSLKALVAHLQK